MSWQPTLKTCPPYKAVLFLAAYQRGTWVYNRPVIRAKCKTLLCQRGDAGISHHAPSFFLCSRGQSRLVCGKFAGGCEGQIPGI